MESRKMKTVLSLTAVGALIGGLLSTWLAPKVISWYFMPPAQIGFSCADPITWALAKLQIAQAVGIAVGAVVGMMLFFVFTKNRTTA